MSREEGDGGRYKDESVTNMHSLFLLGPRCLYRMLPGLTQNYPLCSEIIHEARARVMGDPLSERSWNLARLVLQKMSDEHVPLISTEL